MPLATRDRHVPGRARAAVASMPDLCYRLLSLMGWLMKAGLGTGAASGSGGPNALVGVTGCRCVRVSVVVGFQDGESLWPRVDRRRAQCASTEADRAVEAFAMSPSLLRACLGSRNRSVG